MNLGSTQGFVKWLTDRREEVVGSSHSPNHCPYANYLNEINTYGTGSRNRRVGIGSRVPHTGTHGTVYLSVTDSEVTEITSEIQRIIDLLDGLDSPRITGKEALEAMHV